MNWPNSTQQKYNTLQDAQDAWRHALANGTAYASGATGPPLPPPQLVQPLVLPSARSSPPAYTPTDFPAMNRVLEQAARFHIAPSRVSHVSNASSSSSNLSIQAQAGSSTLSSTLPCNAVQARNRSKLDIWWVVLRGTYPGVYSNRYKFHSALFSVGSLTHFLDIKPSKH